jgi:hypothetical protein
MLPPFKCRMLAITIMAVILPVLARAQQSTIENFTIHVDEPVYTDLPVWTKANLSFPWIARYPFSADPGDFGPNKLEVERNGQSLSSRPSFYSASFPSSGLLDGSIPPPDSPANRLPLHLRYTITEPGTYSVRWTEVRHIPKNGHLQAVVVAQSNWLTFEVKRSTAELREAWLQKQVSAAPSDPGRLVGDFLPSLLGGAPDARVLRIVLDQLYSTDAVVSDYALGSLSLFPKDEMLNAAIDLLHRHGPSDAMALLISWNRTSLQDRKEDMVGIALPYLNSNNDPQVAAALKLLGFVVHSGQFSWPAGSRLPGEADRAVLALAPELVRRGGAVSPALAVYLGALRTNRSRQLLWQLAERPELEHEEALIALTRIDDQRDLSRLAGLLVKPGDADAYGRDRASLPYHLMRAYGDRATPYLERALSESPYLFVRTQCAEQLALKGRPIAFRFFLDAVEKDRFYKPELVTWLKDNFPKDLPRNANDEEVIAFLNSRLHP